MGNMDKLYEYSEVGSKATLRSMKYAVVLMVSLILFFIGLTYYKFIADNYKNEGLRNGVEVEATIPEGESSKAFRKGVIPVRYSFNDRTHNEKLTAYSNADKNALKEEYDETGKLIILVDPDEPETISTPVFMKSAEAKAQRSWLYIGLMVLGGIGTLASAIPFVKNSAEQIKYHKMFMAEARRIRS